jgi:hypothetical protein
LASTRLKEFSLVLGGGGEGVVGGGEVEDGVARGNKTLSIVHSGVGMTKAGTLLCFTPFSLLTEFWMMLSSACHKNAELPLGKFLVSQSHFGMVAAARWIANLAAPCKVPCKILQL